MAHTTPHLVPGAVPWQVGHYRCTRRFPVADSRVQNDATMIHRIRLFHAALAALVLLAYATGDDDSVHCWLGYAVVFLVVVRIAWGLTGVPQLGLMKYYPHFEGLRLDNAMTHPAISRSLLLAIALSIITTAATGIAMDRGRTLGFAPAAVSVATSTSQADEALRGRLARERKRHHPKWLEEVHEVVANLVLVIVGCHVTYLLIWKRPLALFMLFVVKPRAPRKGLPSE